MDPRIALSKTLNKLTVDNMAASTDSEAQQVHPSSGVTPEGLKSKLEEMLDATYVEIEDLSGGCGQMLEAIIVSPQFAKKTTLARARLVNTTLKEEIAAIHAWTAKCHTPEEWEKKKPQT
ncbi:bola-like protein [Lindgomyces ingoldianus]|uniref:Bola-like protein n=1 Tax=Lindgomyces ingoldianus TaxID=673940 RepID=A0ACB6RG15_9PLEO|nr:bola-like protein [Lindgomyces ingoldianus]KAF2477990.1 bola-like protein [Lindgomyces ingoldianus]